VDPIAAEAAAAAQVRTYRDNGIKHSASSNYNRMSAAPNDVDNLSDMDEPMASQSQDAEPPQSHNSSKTNFFPVVTEDDLNKTTSSANSRSTVATTVQYTPQSTSSPYQTQGRLLQQGFNKGSPHPSQKPVKRSGTPEHMLAEQGVELRPMVSTRQTQSPTVSNNKVRSMGGIPTPFAGAPPPTVSSPGRFHAVSQGQVQTTSQAGSHRQYQPSTTYNPGYQEHPRHPHPPTGVSPGRRYLSEGELLESQPGPVGGPVGGSGVMPSTSAGHIQELAGSPQRSFYLWKQEPAAPQFSSPHYHGSDPTSPVHAGHSYAQQVGFYLQQPHPLEYPTPTLQSGGPRTTPSGYPGGPMVPSDHVSPKVARRHFPQHGVGPQHTSSPYSDNLPRTSTAHSVPSHHNAPPPHHNAPPPHHNAPPPHHGVPPPHHNAPPPHHGVPPPHHNAPHGAPSSQPMTFTRALEVSDSIQMRGGRQEGEGDQPRESVYDMNYEISV